LLLGVALGFLGVLGPRGVAPRAADALVLLGLATTGLLLLLTMRLARRACGGIRQVFGMGAGGTGLASLFGAAVGFGVAPVAMAVLKLAMARFPGGILQLRLKTGLEEAAIQAPLLILFLMVVAAPIAEEAFFRGLAYPAFRARFGVTLASLFTTLLFVPLHLSMLALIPLTLLSLVLCLVREVHASITGPIAAHAMYNLTLLLGLAG
jgi:membrane protease YdiL (CAAX protease family)